MPPPTLPQGVLRRRGAVLAVTAIVVTAAGAFAGALLKTEKKKVEADRNHGEGEDAQLMRCVVRTPWRDVFLGVVRAERRIAGKDRG